MNTIIDAGQSEITVFFLVDIAESMITAVVAIKGTAPAEHDLEIFFPI